MNYAQWVAYVKALGGTPTTLPANVPDAMQQYVGFPAARYSNVAYVSQANAGQIDPSAPTVASNGGTFVYVVQLGIPDAPHTMTTGERIANAVFTAGDSVADVTGLTGLSNVVKDIGKQVIIGVAVTLGIALLLKRKR